MEIMNENHTPHSPKRRDEKAARIGGNIFLGAALVIVGLVWLLHNFDRLPDDLYRVIFSWQMLMAALGGYLLAVRKYVAGGIIGGLGLLFVIIDLSNIYVPMGKVALPAIVIAIGLAVILTKLVRK